MKSIVFLLAVLGMGLLIATTARAEFYVGGQAGYAMPNDLSSISGVKGNAGSTATNLQLSESMAYGAKVGIFFPGWFKWLGAEFDLYGSRPSIKAQSISGTFPDLAGVNSVSRTTLTMVHWNANLLMRYPGEMLQPYVGAGVGWNLGFLGASNFSVADGSISPGLNLLAGMRVFVTEKIALFGEVKQNQSKLSFVDNQFTARYRSTAAMFGVTFHFGR